MDLNTFARATTFLVDLFDEGIPHNTKGTEVTMHDLLVEEREHDEERRGDDSAMAHRELAQARERPRLASLHRFVREKTADVRLQLGRGRVALLAILGDALEHDRGDVAAQPPLEHCRCDTALLRHERTHLGRLRSEESRGRRRLELLDAQHVVEQQTVRLVRLIAHQQFVEHEAEGVDVDALSRSARVTASGLRYASVPMIPSAVGAAASTSG